MKFKHVAIGYAMLWLVVIIAIGIFEWNALKDFQFSYEEEKVRNEILAEMKGYGRGNSGAVEIEQLGTAAASGQEVQEIQTQAVLFNSFEIIADSSMEITVNGNRENISVKEEMKDEIYEDYSGLTGTELTKNIYEIKAENEKDILVCDEYGNVIEAVEKDYVAGTYFYDETLANIAVVKFEPYLKHISGMVSLDELTAVMRSDSKAYKAVRNSQQSLEWMIKAKSMEFTREEITDMQIFDENHFACDVYIELTKIPDTERERVVEEQVKYRVLYENVNGSWYIYSFVTK